MAWRDACTRVCRRTVGRGTLVTPRLPGGRSGGGGSGAEAEGRLGAGGGRRSLHRLTMALSLFHACLAVAVWDSVACVLPVCWPRDPEPDPPHFIAQLLLELDHLQE